MRYSVGFARLAAIMLMGMTWAAAMADDLYPPPWPRYTHRTTYAAWDFSNRTNTNAENWWNEVQQPPHYDWTQGTVWYDPLVDGREHTLLLNPGGALSFFLPNWPEPNDEKIIYAQLVWRVDPGDDHVSLNPFGPPTGTAETLINGMPVGGSWRYSRFRYTLDSNPAFEFYVIRNNSTADIWIDQLVIDTFCVPEPGAMAGLGLGAAALLSRVRRRRKL